MSSSLPLFSIMAVVSAVRSAEFGAVDNTVTLARKSKGDLTPYDAENIFS